MIKFCVLASGSSGNAALLATDKTRILVDAGLSMRELGKRLASIGEDLERLDAILITHEHGDHVAGLPVLARSRKISAGIYMTELTSQAVDWGAHPARLEPFQAGARLRIGDIDVQSFTIPHDAIDPVGYAFEAQGVRFGVATDLGHLPELVRLHLRRANLLLLESNHDVDMLDAGPYPRSVKERVRGNSGHLSNDAVAEYLATTLESCTANLLLGHLSEQNNHPEIVRIVAERALEARGLKPRVTVVAQRGEPEVFQF